MHGSGDGGNTADFAVIPRKWGRMRWGYRGIGDDFAGLPRGWKKTLRDYRGDGDEFLRYHHKIKIILFYKK